MSSEMCKRCIHHTVCVMDKNIVGDVFIAGHPDYFDNKKLFERFKEREKAGFPCDAFCGWIPCSERLPEEDQYNLVTMQYANGEIGVVIAKLIKSYFRNETLEWESDDAEWTWSFGNGYAWLPLPEPWRGEEHEDIPEGAL